MTSQGMACHPSWNPLGREKALGQGSQQESRPLCRAFFIPETKETGAVVAGVEARGTHGVMVRERAELVMGVQAGEVSGVGLRQNKAIDP